MLVGGFERHFPFQHPCGGQGCCKGRDFPPQQPRAAAVLKAGTCSTCQSSKGTPAKISVHTDGWPGMFNHLPFNSLVCSRSQSPRLTQINEVSSWPCAVDKSHYPDAQNKDPDTEIAPNPTACHRQSCRRERTGTLSAHADLRQLCFPVHCSPQGASVAATDIYHSWSISAVKGDGWVMSFFSLA